MKVKICNLLRATTYIQLFSATMALGWLSYETIEHSDFRIGIIPLGATAVLAMLQGIYAVAVVRLIHHYAPGHKIPEPSFLHFYKALVGANIIVGCGLLLWFAVRSVVLLQYLKQFGLSDPQRSLQLCIIGSYTIVAIYTIARAAKLKRAILQRQEWQVETWLDEVMQLSAA